MKKIIKLLIIFIFSFVCINVKALDEEKSITLTILDKNYDISSPSDYETNLIIWSETEQNTYEGITYDPATNTLTLDNVNDENNYLSIVVNRIDDLKINLIGKNYLYRPQDENKYGITVDYAQVVINGNDSDLYTHAVSCAWYCEINDLKLHSLKVLSNQLKMNGVTADSSFEVMGQDYSESGIYLTSSDRYYYGNFEINNSNIFLKKIRGREININNSTVKGTKNLNEEEYHFESVFAYVENTTFDENIEIAVDSTVKLNNVKAKNIAIELADPYSRPADISVIKMEANEAIIKSLSKEGSNINIKDSKIKNTILSGFNDVSIIGSDLGLPSLEATGNIIFSGKIKIVSSETPIHAGGAVVFQSGDIYLESSELNPFIDADKIIINDIDKLYLKYTGKETLQIPLLASLNPILLKEDLLVYSDGSTKPTGKIIKQCVDDDYNIVEKCDEGNVIYYIGDPIKFDENGEMVTPLSKVISIEAPNYKESNKENNTIIEEIKDVANTLGVVNIIFMIIGFSLVGIGSYIVIKEVKGKKEM